MTKSTNNLPLEKQLIQLVHQHPQLYDTGHEHYKDIEKRDKIWSEIAEELNLSMAQCKSKWRTLRDAFAKQYKLVQRSQITEDFSCVRFKNYEQLSFLKAFIKPRDPVITDEMIRAGGQDYHLNLTYNLMTGVTDDAILDDSEKHLLMNGDHNMDTNSSDNGKLENDFNGYANDNTGSTNDQLQYSEDSNDQDDLILFNEPQIMLTSSDTSVTTKKRRTVRGNMINALKRKIVEEDPIVIFFRSMGDVARSYSKEIQSELREKVLALMLDAETKNAKLLNKVGSNDIKIEEDS